MPYKWQASTARTMKTSEVTDETTEAQKLMETKLAHFSSI